MPTSTMVEDHIHDEFHAALVHCLAQLYIIFVGAKPGIYFIIICGGVAMIGIFRLVVLEQRVDPNGRDPQILDVLEMIGNSLDVATMTPILVCEVNLFSHSLYIVIRHIPIRKPVGHQQVYHIRG